jgi:hypothetical protein
MTIAQGITRGQLPYRDFVDNKGPVEYLLSAPGLLLGKFTGVWITELILMCVSVLSAYKTALFFSNKFMALAAVMCCFTAIFSFFSVSAGTEEYSLPFLMISFYIFTKYYFSRDAKEKTAGFIELAALGFCFACAVLIRLNMFPLYLGFCVAIFIEDAVKRRFLNLIKYILGFCLGVIIVCVPVFLYLKLNGILDGFLEQVIFGGAAKGFSDSGNIKQLVKNIFIILNREYSFLPVFFGFFWVITKYKHKDFIYYLAYTSSYMLMVLFLSFSSGDSHYNMVLVPFFIPVFAFIIKIIYSALSGVKRKKTALVFLICVCFSSSLVKAFDDFAESFYDKKSGDNSGTQLIKAGKMIDANTNAGDKIISLGINGYIYPFTQRASASKYIYQGSGIDHLSGAREEFLSDVLNGKPAIIAIFSADDLRYDYLPQWYEPIYNMIDEDYRLLSDENGYYLFILNQK